MAPALIALNAKAIIVRSEEEKEVPMESFFLGPNHIMETILKPDQFLKEIRVPIQNDITHQFFLKQRIRHSADFAISSVATAARVSDGIFKNIRIVLGGIAPLPYLASFCSEALTGRRLDDGLLSIAAEASVNGATPLPMNHYKVDLTKALVKRALTSIWQRSAPK